jgi:surface antigen
MFAVHTAGTASMFTIHMPGRIAETVTGGHTVSAIIQPAADKPVPIISSETSAAALAHLSAEQQQQIASWQAAQVVANRNLGGLAIAGDASHGGYPAQWDNVAQDSQLDNWGMYSRECVSYTAWKVYQTYGSMPYWGGVGNANQWVADARNAGIPTSSVPKVHSVAISMRGYYGHAMWVEKVSGDMIYVSQYNYDLHGHYSEMWLSASALTYIYFK